MDIIAPFQIAGRRGDAAQVGAFFKDAAGRILSARTNAPAIYRTVEGQVATFAQFTLPFDQSIFRQNMLFIPYEEFNHLPSGRNTVRCWVELHLKTNGVWRSMTSSREQPFYVTVP